MMPLSKAEKIFEVINYILLAVLCVFFLVPFISVVSTSFISSSEYVTRGQFILFPYHPMLGAYELLLGKGSIVLNAFGVTFERVILGTLLNLVFTFPLAYVLVVSLMSVGRAEFAVQARAK